FVTPPRDAASRVLPPLEAARRARDIRRVPPPLPFSPLREPSLGKEQAATARATPLLGEQVVERCGRVDDTPADSTGQVRHRGWAASMDGSDGVSPDPLRNPSVAAASGAQPCLVEWLVPSRTAAKDAPEQHDPIDREPDVELFGGLAE